MNKEINNYNNLIHEEKNQIVQPVNINDVIDTLDVTDMTNQNQPQPNISQLKRKKIKWTDKHVDILVDWADKAMCYRWLHSRNTDRYRVLNTWFTIPVIIMSTLTGTANFAQEQVPIELRSYYSMVVGSVNLLAGIITTIQNFLKISQLNESHRVASIAWDKFYRKIKLELAKSPDERSEVELFLKNSSEEFDRLIETSPDIDRVILKTFKDTFEGKKSFSQNVKNKLNRKFQIDEQGEIIAITERQKAFKNINKPTVYDYLESVRGSVYQSPEKNQLPEHQTIQIKNIIEQPEKMITEKTSTVITEIVKRKKELEEKEKKINNFCNQFKEKYCREPTEEEIIENLENEQEKITKAIINGFVSKIREKKQKQLNNNITSTGIKNDENNNLKKDNITIEINN
jgi:hypothetical protein